MPTVLAIFVLGLLCDPIIAGAKAGGSSGTQLTVLADGNTLAMTATLDEALTRVRDYRRTHPRSAIVIDLPIGTYRIRSPILIGPNESGTQGGSLTIRGDPGGGTVISGSVTLGPFASTAPVVDPGTIAQLARPALEYQSYRQPAVTSEPLIFGNQRQIGLSRWPMRLYRTGWTVAVQPGGTLLSHPDFTEPPGTSVSVVGFMASNWAYEAIPGHTVGNGIFLPRYKPQLVQAVPRLAVMNVIQLNPDPSFRIAENGMLALSGIPRGNIIDLAVARELIVIERANNVVIENIALEHSVGDAAKIYVSSHVIIRNCYVGGAGGKGISVDGGDHVTIDRCVIDDTGHSGITLFGGDRTTLTGSGHVITDSIVRESSRRIRSYTPGVALLGVGNHLMRSAIYGLPHAAVGISGNDNVVESTDIHAVACETGDVGAIYMGRDWTQRGNRITGNFIHDIGTGDGSLGNAAIYLDDQFSGTDITHNIVVRARQGIVIGGGRDNLITDNVFAAVALSAIWMDQRGLGVQSGDAAPNGSLYRQLVASPFQSPLWRSRYPALAMLPSNRPGAAIGNRAEGNVSVGSDFLHTDPAGLLLSGADNRRAPDRIAQTLGRISIDQQYIALRALLGQGAVSTVAHPGPNLLPLYAHKVTEVADCRDAS